MRRRGGGDGTRATHKKTLRVFRPLFLLQKALDERLHLSAALRKRLVIKQPDWQYPADPTPNASRLNGRPAFGLLGPSVGKVVPRSCDAAGGNAVEPHPVIRQFYGICHEC
jgi:hypothetical protein